jgi:prepilin-type N-terminal cleavage/methylation domain-containing protein
MKKNTKGFTLVELIVVVAVLAILAVAAVLAVTNVQRNARISAAMAEANGLASALNEFNNSVRSGEQITDLDTIDTEDSDIGASVIVPLVFNPNREEAVPWDEFQDWDPDDHDVVVWGGPLGPVNRSVSFANEERWDGLVYAGWVAHDGVMWVVDEQAVVDDVG